MCNRFSSNVVDGLWLRLAAMALPDLPGTGKTREADGSSCEMARCSRLPTAMQRARRRFRQGQASLGAFCAS